MGTVLGWNPPDVHLPRLDTYLMSLCSVTVYRLCTTPLIAQKKRSVVAILYYSKRQLLLSVLVEHTFLLLLSDSLFAGVVSPLHFYCRGHLLWRLLNLYNLFSFSYFLRSKITIIKIIVEKNISCNRKNKSFGSCTCTSLFYCWKSEVHISSATLMQIIN